MIVASFLVFLVFSPSSDERLTKFLKITSCLALVFLYLSVFEVQQDLPPRFLNNEIITFYQFKQQKQRYEKAEYYYDNLFSFIWFLKDKYDYRPKYVQKVKRHYRIEKRNFDKIYNPIFIQFCVFLLFTFLGVLCSIIVELIHRVNIYFFDKKQLEIQEMNIAREKEIRKEEKEIERILALDKQKAKQKRELLIQEERQKKEKLIQAEEKRAKERSNFINNLF